MIYMPKKVEYCGGKFTGLTPNGQVASTMLCFMTKSLTDDYKDIVAMYPVQNLTSDEILKYYAEVCDLLDRIGFNLIAVSVDNAACNRKFFVHGLCGGTLRSHIINPRNGQPVFLIFDPVHCIKNIYNNFQSRTLFVCPSFPPNLPNDTIANFTDIVKLHEKEATLPLRKACKLNAAVLNPKAIEKNFREVGKCSIQ